MFKTFRFGQCEYEVEYSYITGDAWSFQNPGQGGIVSVERVEFCPGVSTKWTRITWDQFLTAAKDAEDLSEEDILAKLEAAAMERR